MLNILPNPVQHQVTVEGIDNFSRLQLLDAAGKLVNEMNTNKQYQVNINLTGMTNGIYLLQLINDRETQVIKLIVRN